MMRVFEEIDCLECVPIVVKPQALYTEKDIERIANILE
jgi:hypothetical protein